MDTLAHGLWGGVGFYPRGRLQFGLALFFGIAPDLFSFGLFHASQPDWILSRFAGETSGPPPLHILPEFVFHAYNWTHSLVVWAAVFALVWLVTRAVAWPLLAWGLHIVCDIPTHGLSYFPTPYLWPLPTPYVQGIPWSTPWFMVTNYMALFLAYAVAIVFVRKGRRASRRESEIP